MNPRTPTIMFLLVFFPLLGSVSLAAWEQSGKVTLGYQSFYSDPELVPANFQKSGPKAEVEPSLQWSHRDSRVKLKLLLGYDYSFSEAKDRSLLIPEEFFWERRRGRNNWSVGINTFNWGITDVINPLDVLNTRAYRNILNPIKIGSPAITWNHARDSWSFEFVYIPVQLPPQLPSNGSRYLPRGESLQEFAKQAQPEGTTILLPNEAVRYQIQSAEEFEDPFKNNVGLKIRTSSGALETHVVAFEGHPGFPNFKPPPDITPIDLTPPNFIVELNPDLVIVPQFQRIRMAGIGWVYSLDSWILKLVHSQVWQTKASVDKTDPTIPVFTGQPKTTVLAIEKPFSMGSLENTLLIQGASQTDPNQASESTISTRAIYDGSLMLGLRTASSLDWSTTLGVLVNPKIQAQVVSYDFMYRWNDNTQLQLVGQSLNGKSGTLLHSVATGSSAALNLISTW